MRAIRLSRKTLAPLIGLIKLVELDQTLILSSHSSCSSHRLLHQGRHGARQVGLPRPEDEPTVSRQLKRTLRCTGVANHLCSNMATFQTYGQNLLNAMKNPTAAGPSNPFQALSKLRNMDSQQLATAGVAVAEVIGFFTIGEMIGRMKFIGYRTTAEAHH